MPILDTEFIFGLSSTDSKHRDVIKMLKKIKAGEVNNVAVSDIAILETYMVLRNRGKTDEVKIIFQKLNEICSEYGIKEINTLNKNLILRQMSIENELDVKSKFFDSLIAASAEMHDYSIISDDSVYDRLGLKRINLSGGDEDE